MSALFKTLPRVPAHQKRPHTFLISHILEELEGVLQDSVRLCAVALEERRVGEAYDLTKLFQGIVHIVNLTRAALKFRKFITECFVGNALNNTDKT